MKHVEGQIFIKDFVSVFDIQVVLATWSDILTAKSKSLAFESARKIIFILTGYRVQGPFKNRKTSKLLKLVLERAGLFREKTEADDFNANLETAKEQVKKVVAWIAPQLNKTPHDIMTGCSPDELQDIYNSINERNINARIERTYDVCAGTHDPKKYVESLQQSLAQIGNKGSKVLAFDPNRIKDDEHRQRVLEHMEYQRRHR